MENMNEQIEAVITFLKQPENHEAKMAFVASLKGTRGRPKKVLTEEEVAELEAKKLRGRGRPKKVLTEEEVAAKIAELQAQIQE